MEATEIVRRLDEGQVVRINRDQLGELLSMTESLEEERTAIAGGIRTLGLGDRVLVQERNPEGDLFVRKLASEDAAGRFVRSRLDAYERMWDG